MSAARILFAGSPDFAVPPLQALLAGSATVVGVLTQPDRPAGRGRKLTAGPVKQVAQAAGVKVLQPATLREAATIQGLRELQPDLLVVVAYGQLLPAAALEIPRVACLNIHASLLPRWRGAAPIQAAILAGDAVTGISLMRMETGLDTGPVYATREAAVGKHETAGQLHDRLATLGATLLSDTLEAILAGSLQPAAQSDIGVTWAPRLRKTDGCIDWSRSAQLIDRQIRAYNPWPVAYTDYAGQPLRCLTARVDETASSDPDRLAPGTLVGLEGKALRVQTGAGHLLLEAVQLPGKKVADGRAFANAHTIEGQILGAGKS